MRNILETKRSGRRSGDVSLGYGLAETDGGHPGRDRRCDSEPTSFRRTTGAATAARADAPPVTGAWLSLGGSDGWASMPCKLPMQETPNKDRTAPVCLRGLYCPHTSPHAPFTESGSPQDTAEGHINHPDAWGSSLPVWDPSSVSKESFPPENHSPGCARGAAHSPGCARGATERCGQSCGEGAGSQMRRPQLITNSSKAPSPLSAHPSLLTQHMKLPLTGSDVRTSILRGQAGGWEQSRRVCRCLTAGCEDRGQRCGLQKAAAGPPPPRSAGLIPDSDLQSCENKCALFYGPGLVVICHSS